MNSNTLTTVFGFIAAIGVAAQGYLAAPAGAAFGSPQFWVGMAGAVGTACWGYWTNHKVDPPKP